METVYCSDLQQANALNAIIGERAHQDAKWGTVEERPKQVGSWLTMMRKLLRDAEDVWATNGDDAGALEELRKVVAVGVACFEQHGVEMRDAPAIEPAPAWPPQKDERLAGLTNNQLHEMYERIRSGHITVVEATSNGLRVILNRDQIDDELNARGDGPIPF